MTDSALPHVFFDEALPRFAQAIVAEFGKDELYQGVILRDAGGLLKFISTKTFASEEEKDTAADKLKSSVGNYARPDGVLASGDAPGSQKLLTSPHALPIRTESGELRLIDRRIIGAAWLDLPSDVISTPPRVVFASLKGGVGRSTALSVTAADLARRNKNVLVIDLDIEAPGIGNLLLDEERLPRFGVVDYLIENGIGGISDSYLSDFIGTSSLTSSSGGRVDVMPALGRDAVSNPGNTLAKLARAMIEDIDGDGVSISFAQKLSGMVERFAKTNSYDVVLLDTKAGLSEVAAPAILGLGASILLFGTAQRQTIQGYEALFAALNMLAGRDRAEGRPANWRLMFKSVYAKASLDDRTAQRHRDNLYDLFAENLYDEDVEGSPDVDAMSFDIDDPVAPHWPLIIPFAQGFVDFDPVFTETQLTAGFYEQTYRQFLDGIDTLITSTGAAEEPLEDVGHDQ